MPIFREIISKKSFAIPTSFAQLKKRGLVGHGSWQNSSFFDN